MKKFFMVCAMAAVLSCVVSCSEREKSEQEDLISSDFQGFWIVDYCLSPDGGKSDVAGFGGIPALHITGDRIYSGVNADGTFVPNEEEYQYELSEANAGQLKTLPLKAEGYNNYSVFKLSGEKSDQLREDVYTQTDELVESYFYDRGETLKHQQ